MRRQQIEGFTLRRRIMPSAFNTSQENWAYCVHSNHIFHKLPPQIHPKQSIQEWAAATGASWRTICYGSSFLGGGMAWGKLSSGHRNCPCYNCDWLLITISTCDPSLTTRQMQINLLDLTPTPWLLLNCLKKEGC